MEMCPGIAILFSLFISVAITGLFGLIMSVITWENWFIDNRWD